MPSTIAERVQLATARVMARLPDRVKIALSGEPPVIVNGCQLDPQVQLLRSIRRRRGFSGLIDPSIAAGRARYKRETQLFRGPMTDVGAVRDFEIPGRAGPLRVRHCLPGSARAPLLVYLHGGGFVIGDLDTHDEPCRILCSHAHVHVLSVDYRLAPEHPFPAAVDDAHAAFAWAQANAESLGADPALVTIGGDSAGANLAAGVALGQGGVSAQLLIYPPTDMLTSRASQQLFAEGYLLTLRDRDAFYHHYTDGTGARADDPRLSPMKASDLSHAPPALVVLAGFDILRDEGEAYANALYSAGAGLAGKVVFITGAARGIGAEVARVLASRGATLALVRSARTDLPTFDHMLPRLPWPFGTVSSVHSCADAIVHAIARRKRRTYVPKILAPFAAFRYLLVNPPLDLLVRRRAKSTMPTLEKEAASLGRAFGAHSAELTRPTRR